jgi:diguanylate cyclase (GGDEF)-like protein
MNLMLQRVRQRISWHALGHAVVDPRVDRAVMARVGIYMFGSGSALALGAVVVGDPAPGRSPVLVGVAIAALTAAAVLVFAFDHLPRVAYRAVAGAGTALVSVAVWAEGAGGSAWVLYLGAVFYAVYFFGRRHAAAQLVAISACFGAIQALDGGSAERWLLASVIVLAAGLLIGLIKERIQQLIAQLDQLSRSDHLTGLLNRRGFEQALARELRRAERYEHPLAVLMADVDGFKRLNDELGHAAGDEALTRIARLLLATKREPDVAARLGGDEFVLVAPETGREEAAVLARRLGAAVAEEFAADSVGLTISIGVAGYPDDGRTLDDLYKAGDDSLYAVKPAG